MKGKFSRVLPSAGVLMALMAGTSMAQEAATTDDGSADEIVVTGTSIRGVAPVGNQVVTMDQEAIQASGATSTAQVLARIPQLSDFGSTPAVLGTNNFQLSVNRPTLRNLGSGVASTSATLFLMDGHRLPGSGVLQTFPDPDVVPPALLQRVEVVPDGGSSIYGSDAVAGVVNFITRSEFDGVEVSGRHGFGDGFDSDEASLTVGRAWDTGSVFGSYSYSNRDPIAGSDRDYVRDINWATGIPTETRCFTPNVLDQTGSNIFGPTYGNEHAVDGGAAVRCDRVREADLFSGDERHSVLVGFSQELSDAVSFQIKGWYTARDVEGNGGPLRGEVAVASSNPFNTSGINQQVRFSFAPVQAGTTTTNHMETYGITPELTVDLWGDWQNRTFATYGISRTNTHNPVINPTLLQAAVNSGSINPYDIADPANIDAVNTLIGAREWRGYGQDEITQVRTVFDGPIFSLPAGEVRVALGAEQFTEEFAGFSDGSNNFVPGSAFTPSSDSRDVTAEFVEVSIPVIDSEMNLPFIHSLDLSLSARHDDYSDVGGVTTKRYGFTYEPVDWISIAGHWGDSFQAPGLADTSRQNNRYTLTPLIPASILVAAEDFAAVNANGGLSSYNFFAIQGTSPGLQPQNAEAWDLSFDFTPPILNDNLTFGATYWSIDYALRIGSALSFIANPSVYDLFPDKLLRSTTGFTTTEINTILAGAQYDDIRPQILQLISDNGKPLYAIYDLRNNNTGGDRRSGVDVRANYTGETAWGTAFASLNATHFIHYQTSTDVGAPFQRDAAGTDGGVTDWRWQATVGTTIGEHWLGQLTWNHLNGVELQGPLGLATATTDDDQSSIDDLNTYDAFIQYDFLGSGLTEDLSFSLGVTNLTDEDPQLLKRTNGQSAGFTGGNIGRLIQVGFTKRF